MLPLISQNKACVPWCVCAVRECVFPPMAHLASLSREPASTSSSSPPQVGKTIGAFEHTKRSTSTPATVHSRMKQPWPMTIGLGSGNLAAASLVVAPCYAVLRMSNVALIILTLLSVANVAFLCADIVSRYPEGKNSTCLYRKH